MLVKLLYEGSASSEFNDASGVPKDRWRALTSMPPTVPIGGFLYNFEKKLGITEAQWGTHAVYAMPFGFLGDQRNRVTSKMTLEECGFTRTAFFVVKEEEIGLHSVAEEEEEAVRDAARDAALAGQRKAEERAARREAMNVNDTAERRKMLEAVRQQAAVKAAEKAAQLREKREAQEAKKSSDEERGEPLEAVPAPSETSPEPAKTPPEPTRKPESPDSGGLQDPESEPEPVPSPCMTSSASVIIEDEDALPLVPPTVRPSPQPQVPDGPSPRKSLFWDEHAVAAAVVGETERLRQRVQQSENVSVEDFAALSPLPQTPEGVKARPMLQTLGSPLQQSGGPLSPGTEDSHPIAQSTDGLEIAMSGIMSPSDSPEAVVQQHSLLSAMRNSRPSYLEFDGSHPRTLAELTALGMAANKRMHKDMTSADASEVANDFTGLILEVFVALGKAADECKADGRRVDALRTDLVLIGERIDRVLRENQKLLDRVPVEVGDVEMQDLSSRQAEVRRLRGLLREKPSDHGSAVLGRSVSAMNERLKELEEKQVRMLSRISTLRSANRAGKRQMRTTLSRIQRLRGAVAEMEAVRAKEGRKYEGQRDIALHALQSLEEQRIDLTASVTEAAKKIVQLSHMCCGVLAAGEANKRQLRFLRKRVTAELESSEAAEEDLMSVHHHRLDIARETKNVRQEIEAATERVTLVGEEAERAGHRAKMATDRADAIQGTLEETRRLALADAQQLGKIERQILSLEADKRSEAELSEARQKQLQGRLEDITREVEELKPCEDECRTLRENLISTRGEVVACLRKLRQ